ncbi:MAG: hypothetical protein IJQ59_01360 [Bacteroidaceae bacterium]|nr:hypothetical protein [Bacteroidaceae bacterium]
MPILIVFLTALLGCTGDAGKADIGLSEGIAVSYQGKRYSFGDQRHGHRHEATLNDARGIYRLCNTRPQRLVPSHGSKPGKSTGRWLAVRRPHVKHFFFLHDGRRRLETAPFQSSASRDYYVFALRHIIC